MSYLLVFFAVGTGLGLFLRNKEKLKEISSLLTNILLGLLIFSLGLSLGRHEAIVRNLKTLGLNAVLLTIGSVLGSILVVLLFEKLFLKDKK